jgi:hypothetical protein
MTTHKLFLGGSRTPNLGYAMFPSSDVTPDCEFESDNRRGPVAFSITRTLTFKDGCGPCGCQSDCGPGSQALQQYYECNTFAVDDIIQTHILPRLSSLERVWLNIITPVPGLTFELRVRGNAASLGGTVAAPVPQVLGTIDAGVAGNSLLTLPAPMYLDQNDMLELVITGYPVGGIECLCMMVSPLVFEYCRGQN